jgi:hypothetical protein
MNEEPSENRLRQAPQSAVPGGLERALERDNRLATGDEQQETPALAPVPFWRRWLPALVGGVICIGCIILVAVETSRVRQLRRQNEALVKTGGGPGQLRQRQEEFKELAARAETLEAQRKDNAEAGQLRAEIERLRQAIAVLATLRAEERRLQDALAARVAQAAAGVLEDDPVAEVRKKAQRMACVNNLKRIALSARIWANDNAEVYPPSFLVMSNELDTPNVLFCPAQANLARLPRTWAGLDQAQISYEMLSPGLSNPPPDVVLYRCPFHHNVVMGDGSVQQLSTNFHIITDEKGFKKVAPIPGPTSTQPP